MRELFRFSVEIPLKMYEDIVLLIEEGHYLNLKDAILKGLEKELQKYDEGYLKELRQKHRDLLEQIRSARSVVRRGSRRRWKPKKT